MQEKVKPFIPAHRTLPEITLKGVVLAIILTVILAAANAYLGLKVGNTVSASIPAAVISMGVLRFFRHSNILENNIVQTSASVGEAMTAGMSFTIPALLVLHFWIGFNYWETVVIGLLGGLLGVCFGVPIRRVLLDDRSLRFPEGTAIGAVLKASAAATTDLRYLILGGLVGGFIEFCQTGLRVLSDSFSYYTIRNNELWGFGIGFSPALIAAGYIIGVSAAVALLTGALITWIFGMPIISHIFGLVPGLSPNDMAISYWVTHFKYVGVGTMLVGGIWTVITLMKPIYLGIKASFTAVKKSSAKQAPAIPRTERDMPLKYVFLGIIVVAVCVFFYLMYIINHSEHIHLTYHMSIVLSLIGAFYVLVIGFILCSVAGYFAGLIGATNCPGSGLIVSGLLILCLIFLGIYSISSIHLYSADKLSLAAIAIIIISFIGTSLVITNETIQDLKAGQIVGATPWKQQVMLLIGAVVAAFTLPLVLQLLFNAYGMGGVFPRPGMDHSQMLAAPQATMMAMVAQGVLTHHLAWNMIITGGIIAVIGICVDEFLKKFYKKRFPVLAMGVGIYLPFSASMPVIFGGLVSGAIQLFALKQKNKLKLSPEAVLHKEHNGLLLACGLVAGAALMGVILAIPFAIAQSSDVLTIVPLSFAPYANTLSIIVTWGLVLWLYYAVCGKKKAHS